MKKYILSYEEIEQFNKTKDVSKDLKKIWLKLKKDLSLFKNIKVKIADFEIVNNKKYTYLSGRNSKIMCFKLKHHNVAINEVLEDFEHAVIAVKKAEDKFKLTNSLNDL